MENPNARLMMLDMLVGNVTNIPLNVPRVLKEDGLVYVMDGHEIRMIMSEAAFDQMVIIYKEQDAK